MKVLWITNVLLPPICSDMHFKAPLGGGWLYSSAMSLLSMADNLTLAVASVYNGTELVHRQIEGVIYYLLPLNGKIQEYHKELEPLWKDVYDDFKPDIVHIHGTEFAHGLSFLNACPDANAIVSIQGMISVIARYYLAGISFVDILKSLTFRSIVKGDNMWNEQKQFYQRGELEKEVLRRVKHVIGRTSWDRVHTWAVNPSVRYHFCNESLRESFYINKWQYSRCEPCSIFVSQAGYPIKGLHQILKAMPYILREYPETKIYVAGENITDCSTLRKRLRMSNYAKYISNLIKKYNLEGHVCFTGGLNEEQMCARYLASNVFISSSSIENSPNSLGEAQMLGMPCLSSYVGGAVDMMRGNEGYMYRFEEYEILAKKVCDIFAMKEKADFSHLSLNASSRFDKKKNAQTMLQIYSDIL